VPVDLVRRAGRVSGPAAAVLAPYAAWTAFATLLSAAIARRNPR
jgi:tryptophan-rich sensory protein